MPIISGELREELHQQDARHRGDQAAPPAGKSHSADYRRRNQVEVEAAPEIAVNVADVTAQNDARTDDQKTANDIDGNHVAVYGNARQPSRLTVGTST